jgi:hypothetical protein
MLGISRTSAVVLASDAAVWVAIDVPARASGLTPAGPLDRAEVARRSAATRSGVAAAVRGFPHRRLSVVASLAQLSQLLLQALSHHADVSAVRDTLPPSAERSRRVDRASSAAAGSPHRTPSFVCVSSTPGSPGQCTIWSLIGTVTSSQPAAGEEASMALTQATFRCLAALNRQPDRGPSSASPTQATNAMLAWYTSSLS